MSATNRRRKAAVDRLHATLTSVVDCVTDKSLIVSGRSYYQLTMRFRTQIAPLSGSGLGLSVLHGFVFDDQDVLHTRSYYYTLHDANGDEFLAYHWHPSDRLRLPHLHLRPYAQTIAVAPGDRAVAMEKMHLPTSRVSLEAVVLSLINEFRVKERHPGWQHLLATSERAFIQRQNWVMRPP